MHKLFKLFCSFLLLTLLFATAQNCTAQVKKKKAHLTKRDSLRLKVLQRDSLIRSFKHSDGSVNILLGKIEDYTTQYVETNADLSKGFDTLDISQRLPQAERRMAVMRATINSSTTLSNLVNIRDMIDHLKEQLNDWEDQLTDYNTQLDNVRKQIADFKVDTALRTVPADTNLRQKCFLQVQELDSKWSTLDKTSQKAMIRIGLLENRVSALSILMIDLDDRIDLKINEFNENSLTNETGFIWDMYPNLRANSIDSAIANTYNLDIKLYRYFLTGKSNYGGHGATLAVLVVFFVWIYSSRRKIKRVNDGHEGVFEQTRYIVKYPYLSALLVTAILSPYFYDHPAQVFVHTMLLLVMGCMGLLIKDTWPKPLFKFWTVLFIATLIFCASSLLTLITYTDRIVLLLLSGVVIWYALQLLKRLKNTAQEYPPYLATILKIYIALQAASVVLNITGRFSLAKIIGVTSTLNLCLGMGFYLLLQILMESLFLQLEANKHTDNSNLTSFLDFKVLQKKSKDILIKIIAILWLVALAKNLTIDDFLYDWGNNFLNHPYQISSTAFTFRSLLVFVAIIWLSGLLARIISYFYDFAGQQTKLTPQAKKTRSSILLIRLTVFVVGFVVAINAAGIPMDRVTIIIGALGVGIGFGLQNIVNNLVSGIILAFEKPVQVGDVIEVSGKSGTIKEIGIRSSKIECGDGSELIVPNGDLISQHVVNWTLSNNNRRVELMIRVAHSADVLKVEQLLNDIVHNTEEIMDNPAPAVYVYNFTDSAVEFRVLFWADDINKWQSLKSKVLLAIYTAFEQEGIEIPQGQLQVMLPEGINMVTDTPPAAAGPLKNKPAEAAKK
jgi:small-conductance mechanosensitive channel